MMSRMWAENSRRSSFERIDGLVVTPLANPRCSAASISARLALSTKIFTRVHPPRPQHDLDRPREIRRFEIRLYPLALAPGRPQQHRGAARRSTRREIAPAVAD